jgi:uncharacterized membrane protein YbhN (UPF0104 family)
MHTSPIQALRRVAYLVPRLVSVVLFGVAIWAIHQQLHQYSLKDVAQSVTAISVFQILVALTLIVLNYGVITGYDTLAIHYIRQSLPYRKIALVAILSTVISNNIGFAVLANSLIRYRFYSRWGITKYRIPHLPLKVTLLQIGISSLDWMLSAAIFYVLLPSSPLLSYPSCLGMYPLAQFAGVISNVPGGLGIFETVMLLLLSPLFSPANLIGALLAFRGIYNFLPFALTLGVLGLYEFRQNILGRGKSSRSGLG